tara:strand:+ start:13043 stop:14266 length:1224 start_codon:yes stop_codon:yes gene_type:complete
MAFKDYVDNFGGFDQKDFVAKQEFDQMASKDTIDAKLEPGEFVVHPKIFQDKEGQALLAQLMLKTIKEGGNPMAMFAGSEMGNYDPMNPNSPQHFFFGKIFRGISRVFKKIVKSPIGRIAVTAAAAMAAPYLLPASISAGTASTIGAAVGSGLATKGAGGTWGQALMNAAGTAAGSYIGGKLMGTTTIPKDVPSGAVFPGDMQVVSGGNVVDLSTVGTAAKGGFNIPANVNPVANITNQSLLQTAAGNTSGFAVNAANLVNKIPMVGSTIAGANLGAVAGSSLGGSLGTMLGTVMDPPKIPSYFENTSGMNVPRIQLPGSTLNLGLGSQGAAQYLGSNLGPAMASGKNIYGNLTRPQELAGVDYLRRFTDRSGEPREERFGTFGNAVYKADRGFSLGGRGGFGIAYY